MKIRNADKANEKIELQMTPMIDIVFQLLIFFIMSFKIVALEGDFNIKMPLAAPREGQPDDRELPPMILRLTANPDGSLAGIRLDQRGLSGMDELHQHIIGVVGDERGPGSIQETAEVELDCDYNLHYAYVIQAITAVSGYLSADNQVVKLVEKIKFSPPRQGPAE